MASDAPARENDEAIEFKSSRGRWILTAAVLGSGMAMLDSTVVGIALPQISRSFHVGVVSLQWVITGYALTLTAFLLLGGSLGDRFGRRKIFTIGVVWFALASAACGLAPSSQMLIGARVVQGIGGALLTPASLAMIQGSFRETDRARAIGAWSGLGGVASAMGPLLGGYLIGAASWRWVFFINAPVALCVLVLVMRHVPETRNPDASPKTDVIGASLTVIFLTGLTYGLIEAPNHGWSSPSVLIALIVAIAAMPAFALRELHTRTPMLPLQMFAVRQFSAVNAVTFIVYGALGGAFFLLPVVLQLVSHYSALQAGLSLLPLTVLMLIFSARSGQLASRIGPRLQMTLGPILAGAGFCLLARVTDGRSYVIYVLPAVLLFSIGITFTVAPLTSTAMSSAPSEHAGIASGVNNVVARAGGLIAVAVLPLLAGIEGTNALKVNTLATGFRTAVLISGVACALGGVLSGFTIKNPPRKPARTS